MHGARPFGNRRHGSRAALAAALLTLPALGSLTAWFLPDLLLGGDAYRVGDFPLLAALGSTAFGSTALAGCFGLFAIRSSLDPGAFPRAVSSSVLVPPAPESGGPFRPDGASPPVLPLLTSYFTLLSGLFRPY
jgi:hypothetical protein